MNTDIKKLLNSKGVEQFIKEIQKGSSLIVEGLNAPAKAFVAACACEASGISLIILTGAGPEEFKL